MEVEVRTGPEWERFARALKQADKPLQREVRKAVNKAAKPAQKAIKAGIPRYMPSGYAPVLTKSLRLRTQQQAMGVRIVAAATGKSRPREIRRMEQGVLRAPSWPRGRRANWQWHNQAIPPGFFTKPIRDLEDELRTEVGRAVREVLERVAAGG